MRLHEKMDKQLQPPCLHLIYLKIRRPSSFLMLYIKGINMVHANDNAWPSRQKTHNPGECILCSQRNKPHSSWMWYSANQSISVTTVYVFSCILNTSTIQPWLFWGLRFLPLFHAPGCNTQTAARSHINVQLTLRSSKRLCAPICLLMMNSDDGLEV